MLLMGMMSSHGLQYLHAYHFHTLEYAIVKPCSGVEPYVNLKIGNFKVKKYTILMVHTQSAKTRRKECHRFWLRLRHAVILISNDRTSASKKINGMALICTPTVSTTAFEKTWEKFYGFRQTETRIPTLLGAPNPGFLGQYLENKSFPFPVRVRAAWKRQNKECNLRKLKQC